MNFQHVTLLLLLVPLLTHGGGVFWTDRGASQLKRMSFHGTNLQTITLSGAVTSPAATFVGSLWMLSAIESSGRTMARIVCCARTSTVRAR
jgi:hypothetical protein